MKKFSKKSRPDILKKLEIDVKRLKTPQGYLWAGIPRFQGLFGRDSLISAWQLLEYDSDIAKNTLQILAKLQGTKENFETGEEPGKILHEYYPKNTPDAWWKKSKTTYNKWLKRGTAYYVSYDSTPLFLIVLSEYFQKTKDKKFLLKLWPNAKKATNWLIKYGDKDKDEFLEYEQKNPHFLSVQCWKDSEAYKIIPPAAVVEIQGYAYAAYLAAAKLAAFTDDKTYYQKLLKEKAQKLKRRFNKEFWMPKESFFAFALNGKKEQIKEITSNPGNLLFSGILIKEKEKRVVKRLFAPDLWTPFGIRTLSEKDPRFNPFSYHLGSVWPHDNWMIYAGLKKRGYRREARKIKNALIKAFDALGCIPELYAVKNNKIVFLKETKETKELGGKIRKVSCPQAWTLAGLIEMLSS